MLRWMTDAIRFPNGLTIDAGIRAEMAGRFNQLRMAVAGLAIAAGVVMSVSGFHLAWIIVAVAAVVLLHALATRRHPRIASALALDILLGFSLLEMLSVPTAVMSFGYITYGVITVLLCKPVTRTLLGIQASALFAGAALWDLPGDQMSQVQTHIAGWVAAAILALLLFAAVAMTIDVLQKHVDAIRRANEDLQAFVRHRDELIATISHETRTPLATVLGFSTVLRDSLEDLNDSDVEEMAHLIAVESRNLSHIIDDLLVVARAGRSLPAVRLEPVRLHGEIDAFLSGCNQIHDPIEVVGQDAEVQMDPSRFRQVLRHLLRNAVIHGGDRVWLETGPGPGVAFVRVCDDGDGIPEGRQEDVFVPYVRLQDRATQTESFGLGLTVARRLADAMGGSLTYRRTAATTIFELTLRSATSGAPSAQALHHDMDGEGTRRVMAPTRP